MILYKLSISKNYRRDHWNFNTFLLLKPHDLHSNQLISMHIFSWVLSYEDHFFDCANIGLLDRICLYRVNPFPIKPIKTTFAQNKLSFRKTT